jgi:hypothetical protein
MKLPIIVDNKGDVLIFDSVRQAERYLEPVDVRGGEYVVYDAQGRVLEPEIYRHLLAERVQLQTESESDEGKEQLRETLIRFLSKVGQYQESTIQSNSVEELIRLARRVLKS